MQTIRELSAAIKRGEIRPTDLIEDIFSRINADQQKDQVFITATKTAALAQAERIEKSVQSGEKTGSLAGVPFTLKDVFFTKGILTTGGSKVMADHVPDKNAAVVDDLYQQDAVLLGKVNLHEFAYGATGQNDLYGTLRNPYDAERLAGGSSSGSAVAVAKGYGAFSLGTDTGGSARVPAALCGLSGFKPTRDLLSCKGVIPLSWSLDHVGVIASTAADIRAVLEGIGAIPCDGAAYADSFRGLRIGIPDSFFYDDLDSDIKTVMDIVKERYTELGAELVPVHLPDLTDSRTASLVIQLPEILSYHGSRLAEHSRDFAADMLAGMAAGQFILAEHYILAKRTMQYYKTAIQDVFEDIDMMLLPSTPCVAPKASDPFVEIAGEMVPAGNAVTRFFSLFNMTGNPSLTSPAGFSKEGLPIGYQLVGRLSDDLRVLKTAETYARQYPAVSLTE